MQKNETSAIDNSFLTPASTEEQAQQVNKTAEDGDGESNATKKERAA